MRAFSLISGLLLVSLCGCLCGAYSGGGDTVYQRGTDTLIVCSNGGYAANLSTGHQEGRFAHETGTIGQTGAFAFQLTQNTDGTMTGLGDGAWHEVTLGETALDHADVECSDLTMRAWWTVAATVLPTNTAFARTPSATSQACVDAHPDGKPQPCEIQMELCTSGEVVISDGSSATYTADAGKLGVSTDLGEWTGTFTDGALATDQFDDDGQPVVWHQISTKQLSVGVRCN